MVEKFSPEEDRKERARRMKEMAESLFHDEIKPPPILHQIRRRGAVVLMSVFSVIIFLFTLLYLINQFIVEEESVFAAKSHVAVSLRRRDSLFRNIVNATLNQAALEYELVRYVADSRSEKPNPDLEKETGLNLEALKGLKSAMASPFSLSKLNALVEQYPQIQFSAVYSQLINNLVNIENTITQKRDAENEAIRKYNTTIAQYPWVFLSKITGFDPYPYYKGTLGIQKAPGLKPQLFDRLLQPETVINAKETETLNSNPTPPE
ncbi:LemA family protein [Deltaproteobacteria bacterium TL4]